MADITGPITSASQIDELQWTLVNDQFGVTKPIINQYYTDLTVKELGGVTYVVGSQTDGNVDLWSYDSATKSFTALASYKGARSTSPNADITDPQIYEIDGKIVILGGSEYSAYNAFSYDPALGPSIKDNDERLVIETKITNNTPLNVFGNGRDATYTFETSDGKSFFLLQQQNGSFEAGTFGFDANGDLQFNKVIDANDTYRSTSGGLETDHVVVSEVKTIQYAENANIAGNIQNADYHQVGDNVFEYIASSDANGQSGFHVVKWQYDPVSGELKASQVIYTDGTTVQDLADAGYLTQPYPATSPFDPTALPINDASYPEGQYLNGLAAEKGVVTQENAVDNFSTDALDFSNIKVIKTFDLGGETYMFAGAWYSDVGAGIFKIDPNTGMPVELIDIVEGNVSADNDDAEFAFDEIWSDIHVVEVTATGEIIIAAQTNSGFNYFQFDPSGGFGSGDTVNTGALTYLGAEGNDAYNTDTSGSVYTSGGVDSSAILPDGSIIMGNTQGIWIADAGVSTELTATPTATVCFMKGTEIETDSGSSFVENLQIGDKVRTRDNGYQTIRWIGCHELSEKQLSSNPKLKPIRIRAGALGENAPSKDLFVSPQHRILLRSKIAERMFGVQEILVAASKLVCLDGIDVLEHVHSVKYYHILCDLHEIVYANGTEAETLLTGPEALNAVDAEAREEILSIFPEFSATSFIAKSARLIPDPKRVKKLIRRHISNSQPILEC